MSRHWCLIRPGGGAGGGASGLPLFESSASLRVNPSLAATPSLPATIIHAAASSFELLGQAGVPPCTASACMPTCPAGLGPFSMSHSSRDVVDVMWVWCC
jgi:hypothetical protein